MEISAAPQSLTSCNCSICRRTGALWAYYPLSAVRIIAAENATIEYIWGDRALALHHCRVCGCITHWLRLTEDDRMGVNARLMALDYNSIPVRRLDGAETWAYLDE